MQDTFLSEMLVLALGGTLDAADNILDPKAGVESWVSVESCV